jgi:hypothetical protein
MVLESETYPKTNRHHYLPLPTLSIHLSVIQIPFPRPASSFISFHLLDPLKTIGPVQVSSLSLTQAILYQDQQPLHHPVALRRPEKLPSDDLRLKLRLLESLLSPKPLMRSGFPRTQIITTTRRTRMPYDAHPPERVHYPEPPSTSYGSSRAPISRTTKACNACRSRKVRCDAGGMNNGETATCSRCKESGVSCVYTGQQRKRGPCPGWVHHFSMLMRTR